MRHAQGEAPTPRAFSSRHFLKLVEEAGKVGFWSGALGNDLLDASPGLHRILGLDPAEGLTQSALLDMIHPEDRATHCDQFSVLRSGQAVSREFRVIRPDRTQRWVLHHAEAIIGPDGAASHALGAVFDVTAHHDAMSAVMQRHDRLNALVAATAAVFWINKANGENAEMPQWMALTGQTPSQMQGLGWLDAVHPDDRDRTKAAWVTAVEHAAPYNTEYRIHCADGIYRWYNARGAPVLNKDGTVREWVGVCLAVPGRGRFGTASADTPAVPVPDGRESLTPAQIRAGRAIADMSKEELAKLADVSLSTVNRLEDGASTVRPRSDTVLAVRRALERAGVVFTFEPGRKPGVREA